MMCCDDLPFEVYGDWGWDPCSPMLRMWVFHQKQAQDMAVRLQGPGNQASRRSRFYRDNTGSLRVAQGKIAPEAMPLRRTKTVFECPHGEN